MAQAYARTHFSFAGPNEKCLPWERAGELLDAARGVAALCCRHPNLPDSQPPCWFALDRKFDEGRRSVCWLYVCAVTSSVACSSVCRARMLPRDNSHSVEPVPHTSTCEPKSLLVTCSSNNYIASSCCDTSLG